MAFFSAIIELLKLLAPVLLYFKGESDARSKAESEVLKETVKDEAKALETMERIHSASDSELIDGVYDDKGK